MADIQLNMSINDQVSSKFDQIASKAKEASSSVKDLGKQLDDAFDATGSDKLASKLGKSIESASDDASELGDKVNEAFEKIDEGSVAMKSLSFDEATSGAEELARSVDEASDSIESIGRLDSIDNVGDKVDDASESMEDLGESAEKAGESLGDVGKEGADGLGNVGKQANETGEELGKAADQADKFKSALKTIAATIGIAKIAGEVKDFISSSIDLGKDFTAQMSEVGAISGASGEDLANLEKTAREYGATTVFSATEAAEALKYMSLAGWSANQSASALGGVLNLAAASGMELGQASDMVTDYLSAFGMQAQQSTYFADMLSYAQSNSNTTAAQLGEAYKNSAAQLHSAGQDVETVTSFLEAMANQGYKGSEAGTALTATMRDITQHMDDGAIKIGETSVKVQDAEGNFRDLTDIMTDVGKATEGMGDAQKAAALASTFTSDSQKAVNMLLNEGMDKVAGYEEALRHASGTSEDMAATMNDNLTGDLANMNSAMEEMKLRIYENMEEPLRDLVQSMTSSTIPALQQWLPDAIGSAVKGISKVGDALSPLFDMAVSNPKAIGTALASVASGLTAFGVATKAASIGESISKAGGLASALKNLAAPLLSNPWAAGAAAVTAAVVGIGMAVKNYNDMKISDSLEEHFGKIKLSAEQVEAVAKQVLNIDWEVSINDANNAFQKADELHQAAMEALSGNDSLEYKARIGISLTADEQQTYKDNIESYVQNSIDELEQRTYAAELSVKTIFKDSPEGESLAEKINQWASKDMQDMNTLQSQLTQTVEKALTDGIIDVNEQAAIDELQTKINNIMSGWDEAQAAAEMDMITQKYGRLSGKDLDEDSFTEVIEALKKKRETATKALEENESSLYGILERRHQTGDLLDSEFNSLTNLMQKADRDARSQELANSLTYESNTVADTYEEKLNENFNAIKQSTEKSLADAQNFLQNQSWDSLYWELNNGAQKAFTNTNILSGEDQQALGKLWEIMKPDAQSMGELIDEYRKVGQQIPTETIEAFNQAMQVGAASGDVQAGWQLYANQLVSDESMQPLEDAIMDGSAKVPDLLKTAVERAVAMENSGDGISLGDVAAEIDGVDVDENDVGNKAAEALQGLEISNQEVKLDGGEVGVEYTVTTAQTAEDIASQLGTTVDELIAANPDIEAGQTVEVGTKITMPVEKAEADASGVGEAAQKAADDATSTPVQTEQEADLKLTTGTADASAVGQEAQKAADAATSDPVETEQQANLKLTNGTTDTSQLANAKEEATAASQDPVNITTPANVTVSVQNIDSSALSEAINSSLTNQEAVSVKVPANVAVEVGTVDSSALSSSIESSLSSLEQSVSVNVPADVSVQVGNVDTGGLGEAVQSHVAGAIQALAAAAAVALTITAGSIDASAAVTSAQSAVTSAFSQPFTAQDTVNVNLSKGTDNIAAVYSQVQSAVAAKFSQAFSASSTLNVSIKVNYSIANPSKTVTFSGAGSGSGTIYAHALGGIFDEPHFGLVAEAGPEAVIPLDGSDNALGLWREAGSILGFLEDQDFGRQNATGSISLVQATGGTMSVPDTAAVVPTAQTQATGGGSGNNEKTINININGQGGIQVPASAGVSKEQVVEIMMDNVKDVFMQIVEQEIVEEGEGVYDW